MTRPDASGGNVTEERRNAAVRRRILVRGAVQGVGFRPFVYREATARGLAGWVGNSPDGVTIEAEGRNDRIAGLVDAIRRSPPQNARVSGVTMQEIVPSGEAGFSIRASRFDGLRSTQILADLATCDACLAEMRDPADRRYRYPFINCTDCGPRYSIVEAIPYDRARTSMRRFAMCAACQAEYDDPMNRRFHAEPNACPDCGPRLALWDENGAILAAGDAALRAAAAALCQGRVVALKGIGGFHLLVDARNEAAVLRLRQHKHREAKPFAVMFPSLAAVGACCRLDAAAGTVLRGPGRPIVLLPWQGGAVAPSVAPGNARLGALLPYAPLHHLLMDELGFPVVATSGNLSDEPIVIDEADALRRLAGIADLLLVHDRPIVRPLDDSVAQIVCGGTQLLRRARGFAPETIAIGGAAEGLLAFGGHLKATVALGHGGGVVVSQHLGDLDNAAARAAHTAARTDMVHLQGETPRRALCDLHPDYASSRAAELSGLPVIAVQHHVAHVAACLAEHGLAPPAFGVAWDGTGYGSDGTVWGGEFLHLYRGAWCRLGRLRRFRLPGGEAAAREPRRAALGLLYAAFGDDAFAMTELPPVAAFRPEERAVLRTALARGVNAPLASSMGRLFDAVTALCGLRQLNRFEGEAAMLLEQAAGDAGIDRAYDFPLAETGEDEPEWELDWRPTLHALLADLAAGVDAGRISASFHAGLARAIAAAAARAGEPRVVLTGGCFQNVRLTQAAVTALRAAGLQPLWHRAIPPNDGGIALGQVAWGAWLEEGRSEPCA